MKTKIYLDKITPDEIIKRIKRGEKVYCSNPDTVYYKLVDNYICRFEDNKCTNIGICLTINCYYYFKEEKPLKFEVGKHYKIRKNLEAVCFKIFNNEECFPIKLIILNSGEIISVNKNGKFYGQDNNSVNDVVDYWKD